VTQATNAPDLIQAVVNLYGIVVPIVAHPNQENTS
jgi:hypothetical protein